MSDSFDNEHQNNIQNNYKERVTSAIIDGGNDEEHEIELHITGPPHQPQQQQQLISTASQEQNDQELLSKATLRGIDEFIDQVEPDSVNEDEDQDGDNEVENDDNEEEKTKYIDMQDVIAKRKRNWISNSNLNSNQNQSNTNTNANGNAGVSGNNNNNNNNSNQNHNGNSSPTTSNSSFESDNDNDNTDNNDNNNNEVNSKIHPGLLASTLKKQQRAWVDDWEAAISDTFYHREMSSFRPTFQTVQRTISGLNLEFFEAPGRASSSLRSRHNKKRSRRQRVPSVEYAQVAGSGGSGSGTGNTKYKMPQLLGDSDARHSLNIAGKPMHKKNNHDSLHALTELDDEGDDDSVNEDDIELDMNENELKKPSSVQRSFGPWDGVMAGCLLNIFGVIMFLRVGWIVGQAGIIQTLAIMAISAVVTTLTALSMSAICTNGAILGGGAYYLISRAMGPAVGGSVGILFALGNMVAVSMYLIGFAETLATNLENEGGFSITGTYIHDVRIWSNIILIFELILALIGLKYVIKAQLGLLAFITLSIICFFIGSFYRKKDNDVGEQVLYAFDGWTNSNLATNVMSDYVDGYDFWSTLAIFFPAVTGIMAGANISGDLRNASSDIPKGTLTAIIISTIVYAWMALFVGAVAARSELVANTLIMADICVTQYIVLVGVYAATLSSGIASLVGAPRILMKVAEDDIFPCLAYFAVPDKNGNPIRGYFLSFGVAAACNCIGSLNTIAPLISEFFMIAYLMINFSCFAMEVSKSPGWRPTFHYFNKWTALLGSILCLVVMFLLEWRYALAAVVIGYGLYMYISWRDPQVNWGSAYESRVMYNAYQTVLKLRKRKKHIKNWRPGFLVLCSNPVTSPHLVLFSQTLRKAHGPTFIATIHTGDYRRSIMKFRSAHYDGYLPLNTPNAKEGFYEAILTQNFRQGVQTLLQTAGMGNIRPNTLVIGFLKKSNLMKRDLVTEYVQILRDSLLMNVNIIICCGFKRINWVSNHFVPLAVNTDIDDLTAIEGGGNNGGNVSGGGFTSANMDIDDNYNYSDDDIAKTTVFDPNQWTKGQKNATMIDVWWMVDDGGFVMLLPYIMKRHSFWSQCKLRLNIVASVDSLATELVVIQKLIAQFRLPYEEPRLIEVENSNPSKATVARFERISECRIRDTPRPKVTRRWLRLSELMFIHSRYSGLNIVTMPIPTKEFNPKAYISMLKMMSDQKRLPPTIIMRGNGNQTLTFYQE